MGVGSGVGSQVGMVAESSYGTFAVPTRFLEVGKAELKKAKNTAQGTAMAAGRLVPAASRRVVTTRAGGGSLDDLVVVNRDMGLLLQAIFGTTVTPVQQAATIAYLQSHLLADHAGKTLVLQPGVPNTGGTVYPYTFLGCKVKSAEFACGVDNLLTVKPEFIAQDVTEGQSLAAASYASGRVPFHFGQMAVKIGAFGAEASVTGVRKVTVKIERPQKDDKFYAGAAGLMAEPTGNDMVKISATIDTDFVTKADFADRYTADTQFSFIWEFVGANIASTYYETFRIKIPAAFLDDPGTPTIGGPDVVQPSFTLAGLNDLTNAPITCEYMSKDTVV